MVHIHCLALLSLSAYVAASSFASIGSHIELAVHKAAHADAHDKNLKAHHHTAPGKHHRHHVTMPKKKHHVRSEEGAVEKLALTQKAVKYHHHNFNKTEDHHHESNKTEVGHHKNATKAEHHPKNAARVEHHHKNATKVEHHHHKSNKSEVHRHKNATHHHKNATKVEQHYKNATKVEHYHKNATKVEHHHHKESTKTNHHKETAKPHHHKETAKAHHPHHTTTTTHRHLMMEAEPTTHQNPNKIGAAIDAHKPIVAKPSQTHAPKVKHHQHSKQTDPKGTKKAMHKHRHHKATPHVPVMARMVRRDG